jgi:hypothetical protein
MEEQLQNILYYTYIYLLFKFVFMFLERLSLCQAVGLGKVADRKAYSEKNCSVQFLSSNLTRHLGEMKQEVLGRTNRPLLFHYNL